MKKTRKKAKYDPFILSKKAEEKIVPRVCISCRGSVKKFVVENVVLSDGEIVKAFFDEKDRWKLQKYSPAIRELMSSVMPSAIKLGIISLHVNNSDIFVVKRDSFGWIPIDRLMNGAIRLMLSYIYNDIFLREDAICFVKQKILLDNKKGQLRE